MKNLIMKNILLILYFSSLNLGYGQSVSGDCKNKQETYNWVDGNIYVLINNEGKEGVQGTLTYNLSPHYTRFSYMFLERIKLNPFPRRIAIVNVVNNPSLINRT